MKIIKTALTTAEASGKTLDKVLLNIRSTHIGPNLPSPREILHNCTEKHSGKLLQPVNFEQTRNYLLEQKEIQKENHDWRHQAKPLPELQLGQQVLFLSPAEHKSEYIKGTITVHSYPPRSYLIETNGRIYCCMQQHIHTVNVDTPFMRLSATQCQKPDHQPKDSHKSMTQHSSTSSDSPRTHHCTPQKAANLPARHTHWSHHTPLQDCLSNQNQFITI